MPQTDFITALGRLLRDGSLRDAFAMNPGAVAAQLNLADGDFAAVAGLMPSDLEFQALVLLRKRFDIVRRLMPETFRLLRAEAWTLFLSYSRHHWPTPDPSGAGDASGFCLHLDTHRPESVHEAERNRLRFLVSKARIQLRCVRFRTPSGRDRRALQILWRPSHKGWRETTLYLKL